MRTEDFDYSLPPELIAQTPVERGRSRMLVLNRADGRVDFRQFPEIRDFLQPGDTLVINDSRVTARRLWAIRENGQPAEVLLLRPAGETDWEALVRPGKRLKAGANVRFELPDGRCITADVVASTPEGGRMLRFPDGQVRESLAREGTAPLPPYIHAELDDEERYQTVYSRSAGSAAAPTAGLHFTEEILQAIEAKGVRIARVTLHVGVDTFRPVKVERLEDHVMHGERFTISPKDAEIINATAGRVVAAGTTTVRALESAATGQGTIEAGDGETRLFITPGYRFQVVQVLLTNFHLPKSTLLMLVSAFATREYVLNAYRAAVEARFRFYSFGDAMLIV
jgi:S-adenosylmethionine:tRNA ribosyltransferase-isomerase